jgi:hypothetical protein
MFAREHSSLILKFASALTTIKTQRTLQISKGSNSLLLNQATSTFVQEK